MSQISGLFFDGVTSTARAVTVSVQGDALSLVGDGVHRSVPLHEVYASQPLGTTARSLFFRDGASLTIEQVDAFHAALGSNTLGNTFVSWAQNKWWLALFASIALALYAVVGYFFVLPVASRYVAHQLPPSALELLGDSSLSALESMGFEPTKLTEKRQEEIIAKFEALRAPDEETEARQILFRANPEVGPNAIALPDGTIVVTDELVALAQNDDQILGVLCHELGHVYHRHGAQMVVQGAAITAFLAIYIGDFSAIATGAAATLLSTNYSRDAERESDDFAIAMMKKNGKSPKALSDLLARMDHGYRAAKKDEREGKKPSNAKKAGKVLDYFSSHPATKERIAHIEAAAK